MARWTESQLDAIEARRGTVLVSAAAGSGKTSVLVERIIQRLTDPEAPTDADRLLVVTFTRAAAAEMRSRIEKAIVSAIKADPNNARLRKQQLLLSQADICTVDSYCSKLTREFFYKLQIDSDFKIIDDKQRVDLQGQAMEQTLNDAFANGYPEIAEVFSSEKNDSGLSNAVMTLYEFTRSHLFPDEWLRETAESYDSEIPVAETKWGRCIIDYALDIVDYSIKLTEDSIRLCAEDITLKEKLLPVISDDLSVLNNLMNEMTDISWNNLSEAAASSQLGRFPTIRGYSDDPVKCRIQNSRKSVSASLKDLSELLADSEEDIANEIALMSPLTNQLVEFVRRFNDIYDELKREKGVADYSDIEHWAIDLLLERHDGEIKRTELAELISRRYDEIMIDEYQDTNEVQDWIFRAISKDDANRFMVGDVKQSIYSFRQAMPDIFISYKNQYAEYDRSADSYPASVVLDKNFRSRPEVIKSVNYIFSMLMSAEVGGIDYGGSEALSQGLDCPEKSGCDTLIDFIEKDESVPMAEAEAGHIASIIKDMLADGYTVTDNGTERPAKYSDFCVLLRSSNKYAYNYSDEMARCGVPAWAAVSGGFFAAAEILGVMAFMQVIDNPNQDIPLLSVLMSPVYGFNADDLAQLRLNDRQNSIYVSILNSEDDRFAYVIKELEEYRIIAASMPSDAFLTYFYDKTGYLDIVRAMDGGDSRVANLRRLRQYAGDYEKAGYVGISGFVRLMNKLRESKTDMESANLISENADVVRVMSVHKSKGLEFPVCIIAGCGRKFVAERSDIVLNSRLGFGTKLKSNGVKYTNIVRDSIILENDRNSASEELRIFYVAMTRAREKLIMISTVDDPEKTMGKLAAQITDGAKLTPFTVRNANSIAQWLMLCSLRHPNADVLRHRINADDRIISRENYTPWEIRIIPAVNNKHEIIEDKHEDVTADPKLLQIIKSNCEFVYPDYELNCIPAKVTASQLAGEDEDQTLQRPSFMSRGGLTPAERGTALHEFMQYADFESSAVNADAELVRLVEQEYLSQEQAKVIDLKKVKRFLNSDLGKRILASGKVVKEQRFTVHIPAYMLPLDISEKYQDIPLILQGAVDCWFEEDGRAFIVDFKTDNAASAEEIARHYAMQLKLYRKAMEEILDIEVADCYIYSFKFDEAARIE